MLINLLSAFLKDVLTVARTEDFFALSETAREKKLKALAESPYPQALSNYLVAVTPENFMADVQALLPVLTASHGAPGHLLESTKELSFENYPLDLPSPSSATSQKEAIDPAMIHLSDEFLSDIKSVLREIIGKTDRERRVNGFVRAFSIALSQEVADAFDQEALVSGVFGPQASIVLEQIFTTGRTVEVGREIQSFLHEQIGIASPTVQSPYPFSIAQKQEMRVTLRERYPGSFALFEVEPSLAGGLRVFYQGELLDESWMTHVAHAFSTLRQDRSSTH